MQEEWKNIKGYEGIYQVSNLGRVRSVDRIIQCYNGHGDCKKKIKGRVLAVFQGRYQHVILTKDRQAKSFAVHHLVWDNFTNKPRHNKVIDHKDNIGSNNRLSNLQLLSHRDNIIKDMKNSKYPTGVSYDARKSKYQTRVTFFGKRRHLGLFNTPEQASMAYKLANNSRMSIGYNTISFTSLGNYPTLGWVTRYNEELQGLTDAQVARHALESLRTWCKVSVR